jgi:PadR family transcriptional regulator, regulatory protein PadR
MALRYIPYAAGERRMLGRERALGSFEYQILSVLINQPRDAYGSTIMERLAADTGREPSVGAIYTALDRMERKGFVSSWWGEATAERGGRRKRYYQIEASGREAVRRTESLFTASPGHSVALGVA